MRTERRARISQLANDIQRSTDFQALNVKELLALRLEELKDSLLDARGDETIRLQGAAQEISKLRDMVTKSPPRMQPRKEPIQ